MFECVKDHIQTASNAGGFSGLARVRFRCGTAESQCLEGRFILTPAGEERAQDLDGQ